MMRLLSSETRTARKDYPCGAYYWFDRSCHGKVDFEPQDWMAILVAMQEKGCILKGSRYLCQSSVDGDGFSKFRARQDMHDICLKYNLYPEY